LEANLLKINKAVEQAAKDNARLLLLPECCVTGADWPVKAKNPSVDKVALCLDSNYLKEIVRTAKRTGVVVAAGFYEKHKGRIHITQALLGPKGFIGVYRKVHEGSRSSRDRNLFPVFDLGFARVGISICYDNMFPECSRILALKGAEILLAPFTSLPLHRHAWKQMRLVPLRARAMDNRVFVLSASHAQPHVKGKPPEWGYSGICCAIDPLGRVLGVSKGRAGRPQRLKVRLEQKLLRTYFIADVPSLRSRRPEDYKALTDKKVQKSYLKRAPARYLHATVAI
jgi:predicted amidohydrolase